MSRFFTGLLYCVVVVTVLQNIFLVAVPLAVWFSFRTNAFWLLPAAFLIDGYFGAFYNVPILSLITGIWCLAIEYIKPHVRWQTSVV